MDNEDKNQKKTQQTVFILLVLTESHFATTFLTQFNHSDKDVTADSPGNRYCLLLIPGDGDCLFGPIAHQFYDMASNYASFIAYSL